MQEEEKLLGGWRNMKWKNQSAYKRIDRGVSPGHALQPHTLAVRYGGGRELAQVVF